MTTNQLFSIIFVIVSICVVHHGGAIKLRTQSRNHRAQALSDQQIIKLAQLSNVTHFESTFTEILVPRVVGTASHEKVKNFIFNSMQDLGWNVELHTFKENTPIFGQLIFSNVIATMNPRARRNLVLACHYDSKYFAEGVFLAATDSAVPCAMMINLAHTMQRELGTIAEKDDLGLQFVFFDGEEAFKTWSATDSIYGARNLAEKWSREPAVGGNSYLDRIDVMVLLDLLGAANPNFFSFFQNTEIWYRLLVDAETKLASSTLRQFTRYSVKSDGQRYFHEMSTYGGVEDDHIPFQKRHVPILHVIPMPFPKVWHTLADNRSAVDPPTVENLNMILRVFVAEYLHLRV